MLIHVGKLEMDHSEPLETVSIPVEDSLGKLNKSVLRVKLLVDSVSWKLVQATMATSVARAIALYMLLFIFASS